MRFGLAISWETIHTLFDTNRATHGILTCIPSSWSSSRRLPTLTRTLNFLSKAVKDVGEFQNREKNPVFFFLFFFEWSRNTARSCFDKDALCFSHSGQDRFLVLPECAP